MSRDRDHLLHILQDLGEQDFVAFKHELRTHNIEGFKKIPWCYLEKANIYDVIDRMVNNYCQDGAVKVTLAILKKIHQNQPAKNLRSMTQEAGGSSSTSPARLGGSTSSPDSTQDPNRQAATQKLKSNLKRNFETLFEGPPAKVRRVDLNEVYTKLYAVEGWTGGVCLEHEFIHNEAESWRCSTEENRVMLSKLFQSNESKVLTIGIAGVGKTVAIQKFVLDWVEGHHNQDVDFVFPIPFRDLNLLKDEKYSFQQLLLYFYPELKNLKEAEIFDDESKVLFILDGLDEFTVPLEVNQKRLSDVTEKARIEVLITNLIKGHLLPSALIWVTSRPSTADQIPNTYRVTELRGFSDVQKEEYFKKRLPEEQAERLISHVEKSKSLQIMCHMPIFCWIMTSVLKQHLNKKESEEIPKTLTEIYTHFLVMQANMKCQKYDESPEKDARKLLNSNREVILQLAELAFKQLVEGKVVFYEEDLKECGINMSEPSMCSGICSEFFLEESFVYQRKVYCFVHLSFQEFLAAFYVFYCYVSRNMKPLHILLKKSEEVSLNELLCKVVDLNLWSKTGRYDLFLRFLVGISLESNQRFLQGILTHVEHSAESISRTVQYIKQQIQSEDLPVERSINLFLCLLEMNDQSFYTETREFLTSAKCPEKKLKSAQCSAIAHVLHISGDVLDELDPKKYTATMEGYRRLIPAVGNCKKALLASCSLTERSCEGLTSALQKLNTPLRELDLTNNDLRDPGVKLLSAAFGSPNCKLEILRLSGCMITENGCYFLAAALSSNRSNLRELDLSYNNPGESGMKMLSDLKEDRSYRLEELDMSQGGEFRIKPGLRKYTCDLTLDVNTADPRLSLSEGNRKASWEVQQQEHPHHPERSDWLAQVLSKEGLCDRSYWEVECSGRATVAVAYRGVIRKAETDGMFGYNNTMSWSLTCATDHYVLQHSSADLTIEVPAPDPQCSRVGVYLDCPAGTLTFYSVASTTDTLNLIHTFHCRFIEPLYAGFAVDYGGSVTLVHMQ